MAAKYQFKENNERITMAIIRIRITTTPDNGLATTIPERDDNNLVVVQVEIPSREFHP